MSRRALLRFAQNWPKHWRPLPTRLPRFPDPLPIQLAHVAQWFHALSDTRRLHLLELLSQRDRCVTELRELTDIPHASVVFHLTVLKKAGLIREYRAGRQTYYSVQQDTLADMAALTKKIGPEPSLDVSRNIDTLTAMASAAVPRPTASQVARWFHALSDEARVQIVELLSHKERCVCELEQVLGIAQSRLSFHLKVLKDAGLLADRKEGRWMYYNLQRETLDQIGSYTKSVKPGKHAGSCTLACCD